MTRFNLMTKLNSDFYFLSYFCTSFVEGGFGDKGNSPWKSIQGAEVILFLGQKWGLFFMW